MDLMKMLRSLEEFLFEAIALLFFVPKTLWHIATKPLQAMRYVECEEAKETELRYADTVSPPLLLLIVILISGSIALAAHAPQPTGAAPLAKMIFDSPQLLLLFRGLLFSLIPLVIATSYLRRKHTPITRLTLRTPFFSHCFLATPFVLVFTLANTATLQTHLPLKSAGLVAILLSSLWLVTMQAKWLRSELGLGVMRSLGLALWADIRALIYLILIALAVNYL